MVQYFKGDPTELKMLAVGEAVSEVTIAALNDMYEQSYMSADFILKLYDEGRMPFSQRIQRDVFFNFITEMLERFPVTGTFDSYTFLLTSVFGSLAEVTFAVPDPGKLSITVNAAANVEYDFIARELFGGAYVNSIVITQEGDQIVFNGISGIDTEYDLQLLFSEIMPAGIIPTIALTFYVSYDFIGEDGSGIFDVITQDLEQIIFRDSEE